MQSTKTEQSKMEALEQYEDKQAKIEKLLKEIKAGLLTHDRDASSQGGHNWGHVGDLESILATLTDIKDRLHGTGEYAGS
jgi:hypothetical protein